MRKNKLKENLSGYTFVLPSAVMLFSFIVLPIIMVFYYSFTNHTGGLTAPWVGLKNYLRLFADPAIGYALKNTAVFVVVVVPCIVILSLLLAAVLAQYFQGKFGSFCRSTLFIPVVCSATVAGTIWYYLFSSDPAGFINLILHAFGVEAVDWLGQTDTAMFAICFVNVWKSIGYFMVIFYAAIMEIPRNLLEAASIDGATKWQQMLHIILPNIKSTTSFVVSINCIWAFQIFDLAYTMTHGGPGYGTSTLIYRIYQEGFWNWKMGYACAISVVLFLMILVVSAIVRKLFPADKD